MWVVHCGWSGLSYCGIIILNLINAVALNLKNIVILNQPKTCHPEPTKTCHPDKAHSKIVILSEAEGSEFLRFAALSQDDRMDALSG